MRVAAPCRELPCFSEKRGCLVLQIAHTSEVHHDLGAHGGSLSEALRRLRERVQKLPHGPPVPERLDRIVEPHPLGGPAMPLRRLPSVARVLPVVGEKRSTLAKSPRLDFLDRTRDPGMDAGSSLCELRAVGDFLGQGVLEGVLGLRIERLQVKELGTRQGMESGGQLSLAEVGHALENRLRELLADHRRRLQHPLLPLGEAVNPCREYALHGRGQANLFCRRDQAIRTPGSRDNARLDQRLDDLLDEEWIAARSLLDELAESMERRITAEEIAEQLGGRFGAQWKQWQLMIVRPLHPSRVVLGAKVEQQQTAASGCSLDHVLEELLARAVEPVKILEEEDGWLPSAASMGEPADDVEELPLPNLWPHRRHRPLGIG